MREIETSDATNKGIINIKNLYIWPETSKVLNCSARKRAVKPSPPNELDECPEGKLRLPSVILFKSPWQTILGRSVGSGLHLERKSGRSLPTGD